MKIGRPKTLKLLLIGFVAGASLIASYFLPIWSFHLVAPQYPQGLQLLVYLDGVRGDVFEIDIINHYIGMGKLADAATLERALSKYLVGIVALWAMIWPFLALRVRFIYRWGVWGLVLFPVGFVIVFFLWLYHFGHNLDPHAIMRMAPFTPAVLGVGKIGQFLTRSQPSWGFAAMLIASGISLLQKKTLPKDPY